MQRQGGLRKACAPSALLTMIAATLAVPSVSGPDLPSVLAAEMSAAAPTPTAANTLTASQRQVVESLLETEHPYACCPDNLRVCLEKKPVCQLAARLQRTIVRMAGAGLSKPRIQAALAWRKATTQSDASATIVAGDTQFRAGNPRAPVTVAIYACPRNPACASLIPDLYREVASGRLRDKASLVYRPFFAPDDDEATSCARGLYAAAYQGAFWPYLIHLCLERENLGQATLRDWAGSHGLDRCIFDQTCEQARATQWLQASRKEGLANGVTTTPAAFIDGRRVQGNLDVETLVDLAEDAYEQAVADRARGGEEIP